MECDTHTNTHSPFIRTVKTSTLLLLLQLHTFACIIIGEKEWGQEGRSEGGGMGKWKTRAGKKGRLKLFSGICSINVYICLLERWLFVFQTHMCASLYMQTYIYRQEMRGRVREDPFRHVPRCVNMNKCPVFLGRAWCNTINMTSLNCMPWERETEMFIPFL